MIVAHSMSEANQEEHWEAVYTSKQETDVSWYQESPVPSLELIDRIAAKPDWAVIDVGGGASRLADALLERGFHNLAVLDISVSALDLAALRLGRRASEVRWIVEDVTVWEPSRRFDLWHDRAAFHFLVEPAQRAAYVARLTQALRPGGFAIIATFAKDGPDKCSGLPVRRYDPEELARELGDGFALIESRRHDHSTPWNSNQRFQFSVLQKRGGAATDD
jgi:SAM-dependent methyltransferase